MRSSPPSVPAADARGPSPWTTAAAALAVAVVAFLLYHATLLPGVDFGDTGSFQATVGSPIITPRDGYPLYFAIGDLFLRLTSGGPAHAVNLASAVEGAIACGLLVVVAAELTASVAAAAAAALLFAASYTFWSQCVTAEVYALHLTFVLASLWLILRWERQPTLPRLAAFFSVYALAFGNHLSMILLAPGFTVFLLRSAPGGWRSLVRPRIVALAAGIALVGSLQYVWNIRGLWMSIEPPATLWSALQTFWFDVTKSDWRNTMVLEVPRVLVADHAAMYWFDLRQQFGVIGPLLAGAGLIGLARVRPRRAELLALLFAVNFAFAFTYNVGDAHVFYLPSHLVIALLAAVGVASTARMAPRPRAAVPLAAAILAAYAGARAYRDFPALDRSHDDRPSRILRGLTADADDRRAILLVDLNWQIANGLSYYTKIARPDVAIARMRDVLPYAPVLVDDNAAIGRRVLATDDARRLLAEAYGPLVTAEPETVPRTFTALARDVPPRTRYVVCVLKPTRDVAADRADLLAALAVLSGGSAPPLPSGDYVVVAGVAGSRPVIVEGADRPFTRHVDVDGVSTTIRMESWLASDTIRRMGFGHVIAGRQHTLIVERGVSFATFDAAGAATRTAYFSGIFAEQPRYLIRPR